MAPATSQQIQLIYLAYFGHPAPGGARDAWEATGLTADAIAPLFTTYDEFRINTTLATEAPTPTQRQQKLVQIYYNRLFDRNANSIEQDYWVRELVEGRISEDLLGLRIAEAGLLAGGAFEQSILNKLAFADGFSDQVDGDASLDALFNTFLSYNIVGDLQGEINQFSTPAQIASGVLEAIDSLPPDPAIDFTLTNTASTVEEGEGVVIELQAYPLNEPPSGKTYQYRIIGDGGFGSSDIEGGSLIGTVTVDANGKALIQVSVKEDDVIESGESFQIQINGFSTYLSEPIDVIDTTPPPAAPTYGVNVAPLATDEPGQLLFTVTTTGVPANTQLFYELSGENITSGDFNGTPLKGSFTVNASGTATILVQVAADAVTEGEETVDFDVKTGSVDGPVVATTSAVINDTSLDPVLPISTVLTPAQDIVAGAAVPVFTFFGNQQTLGQNDQLSKGEAEKAILNVGTVGSFDLSNFSTDGVHTLQLNPSGETLANIGNVDLSRAQGLSRIEVSQSQLGALNADDIQVANGFAIHVFDSISTFNLNFDANATQGFTLAKVSVEETPIDETTGEAVGFDFTQGPTKVNAEIEALDLISTGSIKNFIDQLSVGPALETLTISGDPVKGSAALEITTDLGSPLGIPGLGNDNSNITFINAFGLDNDLTLTYTSGVGDPVGADNKQPDVRVIGAKGDNKLLFDSFATNPTDFFVATNDGDDTVKTVGGADLLTLGEGDNSASSGAGDDSVSAGAGNDSIDTGDGADSVAAGAGNNFLFTGLGNDTIISLGGNDSIDAGDGNDTVNAGNGQNTVVAGLGNDTVLTGTGNDLIVGDAVDKLGPDFPFPNVLGNGNDSIASGEGADTIWTGAGRNTVIAGSENDVVYVGQSADGKLLGDGDANTVLLGEGNDRLIIDTESLTNLDSINGGAGIDSVELVNGGVLRESETLRTRQVEVLGLTGIGDYDVTLSDELVRSSDWLLNGSRAFAVDATTAGGNVFLDLSRLTPVDAEGNLLSIRYHGQEAPFREVVTIRDGLINDQTILNFEESFFNEDDLAQSDVLRIVDTADVTKDDLINIRGLEVIELARSANGAQEFLIELPSGAAFDELVGGPFDELIIRATPSLNGAVSKLTLVINDPFVANRVTVEQTADLNVEFPVFAPEVVTALFYTPNADRIPKDAVTPGNPPYIRDGATVIAYQGSDVQSFDFVNADKGPIVWGVNQDFGKIGYADDILDADDYFGGNPNGTLRPDARFLPETIEFRFAPSNPNDPLEAQLNFTEISGINIFRFVPAAVNQAVSFDGIEFDGEDFAHGLDSIITSGGDDRMVNIERSLFFETDGGDDTIQAINTCGEDICHGGGQNDIFQPWFPLVALTVVSGSGDDSIVGGDGGDSIAAGEGDDIVFSGKGNDSVDGGTGDNFINTTCGDPENPQPCFPDDDYVITTVDGLFSGDLADGDNTIFTGIGEDTVFTGGGDDSIDTGSGDDLVGAGNGDNTIFTGTGADDIVSGSGDDFIKAVLGNEADNDTVDSGGGRDSIFVGLGEDTVFAGDDNDLIVLDDRLGPPADFGSDDPDGPPSSPYWTGTPGGLSSGDSIDGGDGYDILAFAIRGEDEGVTTDIAPNLVDQPGIEDVEAFAITVLRDDQTIRLGRTAATQAGGTLNVLIGNNDTTFRNTVLDASPFTVGESLVAGVTDIEEGATVIGGAGDDVLFTVGAPEAPTRAPFGEVGDVEGDYTYYGLGGSDTINLRDDFDFGERVGYDTANDGGNGGDGLGGDTITGFNQTRDSVFPFTDIEDLVVISGSLKTSVLNVSGNEGTNLSFVFNDTVDFIGAGPANRDAGLIIGNGVSDALLEDPTGIAQRMNGFGVNVINAGRGGLVVIQGSTASALYAFVENGEQFNNVSADELYKLGTFEAPDPLTDDAVYLGGYEVGTGELITTNSTTFDSANFIYGPDTIV